MSFVPRRDRQAPRAEGRVLEAFGFKAPRSARARFKDFLVNLTPPEWKEQKREEKKQRKLQRRRIAAPWPFWEDSGGLAKVDARMGEIEEKMQAEIEAEEAAFREKEEKEKPLDRTALSIFIYSFSFFFFIHQTTFTLNSNRTMSSLNTVWLVLRKGRRRQKKTEEDEQKERDQMEARRRRIASRLAFERGRDRWDTEGSTPRGSKWTRSSTSTPVARRCRSTSKSLSSCWTSSPPWRSPTSSLSRTLRRGLKRSQKDFQQT